LQLSIELGRNNFRPWACFGSVADYSGFDRVPIGLDCESPEGDTCPRRDGVRKTPGSHNICAVGSILRIGDPYISLASVACTQEGICDGVTHTQVVILASRIGGPVGESIDSV